MNFAIQPYIGAGIIKFGMSQNDIRNLIPENELEDFKRSSSSISDYASKLGLFIYYDNNKIVEALEFHEPASVILNENNIFQMKALDAYNLISSIDKDVVIDNDGLTSFVLGIGFYAPNYDEDNNLPIEGIIIFKEGYYNE